MALLSLSPSLPSAPLGDADTRSQTSVFAKKVDAPPDVEMMSTTAGGTAADGFEDVDYNRASDNDSSDNDDVATGVGSWFTKTRSNTTRSEIRKEQKKKAYFEYLKATLGDHFNPDSGL